VVMAPDPEGSRRRHAELAPLFDDAARVDAIEALLQRRALEWAQAVAGDGPIVTAATDLTAAVAPGGPTLIVWPELPAWLPETGAAALDDLAAGCAVSIGPVFDGALYLLALAEPTPELVALGERPWQGLPTMTRVFGVVDDQELEVGLLRAERGLSRAGDVAALRADPMTDPELRALLG
jgi:glycosyltransferase A (GT-A) superfamily protein (DUF2064 family)